MRDLNTQTERRVNIDLSFAQVETAPYSGTTKIYLHDSWDDKRKKQPVYELNLNVGQVKRLAEYLLRAIVAHRQHLQDMTKSLKDEL